MSDLRGKIAVYAHLDRMVPVRRTKGRVQDKTESQGLTGISLPRVCLPDGNCPISEGKSRCTIDISFIDGELKLAYKKLLDERFGRLE